MDDQAFIGLVRDVEGAKAQANLATTGLSRHEQDCERRYSNIEKSCGAMQTDIGTIIKKIEDQSWAASRWVIGVAGAIIILLVAGLGWAGGQLYQLEPARVASHVPDR